VRRLSFDGAQDRQLLPLILRLLIAAAIAGVLGVCSLVIERTKGLFKFSDGADIHEIIGRPAPVLPLPGQEQVDFTRATLRADQPALQIGHRGFRTIAGGHLCRARLELMHLQPAAPCT
jgi:hypothetical protein